MSERCDETAKIEALRHIDAYVCGMCLTSVGAECHVPGCVFWMHDVPTEDTADALRSAIEPRCTCSGITSQHGVDQNFGPDKVWRCDECDRIWEPSS